MPLERVRRVLLDLPVQLGLPVLQDKREHQVLLVLLDKQVLRVKQVQQVPLEPGRQVRQGLRVKQVQQVPLEPVQQGLQEKQEKRVQRVQQEKQVRQEPQERQVRQEQQEQQDKQDRQVLLDIQVPRVKQVL